MTKTTRRWRVAVDAFVGCGLTVALLSPLTALAGVSSPGTLVWSGLGSLVVGPLLVATSDTGHETASAGGVAGFQNVTDPSSYQPESHHIPGRVELAVYLVGVGCWCLVVVLPFV